MRRRGAAIRVPHVVFVHFAWRGVFLSSLFRVAVLLPLFRVAVLLPLFACPSLTPSVLLFLEYWLSTFPGDFVEPLTLPADQSLSAKAC
jgi:hypothetical protein